MKVLMVTTAFPRWADDGDGAFVSELARALNQRGTEVIVLAMHSSGALTKERMSGIQVLRPRYLVPTRWEALRKAGAGGIPVTWRLYPGVRWQIAPFLVAHCLGILRFFKGCDVIHAHWTFSAALAAILKPIHGLPVVATLHGTDVFQAEGFALGRALLGIAMKRCDMVTAVSSALSESAVQYGKAGVEVIPNGVDTSWFFPRTDVARSHLVLFVGSLIERKGVRYLIEAMSLLSPGIEAYQLVIVGDGPLRADLEIWAVACGVSDKVSFLGSLPRGDVRRWMQEARVLVLPSNEEGMGVVLLEAMACGTPVVGSNIGGIPEVITLDVGRVVPVGDAGAIAEAIEAVVSDDQDWQRMSTAARRRVESHYSWGQVSELVERSYRCVTDKCSPGGVCDR